ncbi:hypothetical protein ACSXAY_02500 [Clostridium perfringens]
MRKYIFPITYIIMSIILLSLPIGFARVIDDMIQEAAKEYNSMFEGLMYVDLAILTFFIGMFIIVSTMLFCNYMKIKKIENLSKQNLVK